MNSITSKFPNYPYTLPPSLKPLHPLSSLPLSSLSLKYPSPPPPRFSIQSSSSQITPTLSKILKPALIPTIATTALLFSSLNPIKPAFASPAPPPQFETQNDLVLEESKEIEIEEYLNSNPNDINALRTLMEIKIKSKKITEALYVIDKLIDLEPNEVEWPLLKSHLHVYNGDIEKAKVRFSEIIDRDPLRVEAYHGLVMATSEAGTDGVGAEMKGIEARIEEGMRLAKKEGKRDDLRDFRLLIAQVRVMEGRYDEALQVYRELVKEEPRDFRPYLCQGIIYTLLKKNGEAEKSFEKYRRLVPKGHPYASYFDDNMMATKLFAQKVESERAGMKSGRGVKRFEVMEAANNRRGKEDDRKRFGRKG